MRCCHWVVAQAMHKTSLVTWMASRLLPGVALKPSTRNLPWSWRILVIDSTAPSLPTALWHSSTTRHVTFS